MMNAECRMQNQESGEISPLHSAFIIQHSAFPLDPRRAAALGLDELPEAAGPLPDERLLVEREADVGPLAEDVAALGVVHGDADVELRDQELLGVLGVGRDVGGAGE